MKIETFEDIIAWQKARDLTVRIYDSFKSLRDFSFRDQIQRAAVSVMNNIAEGFEKRSDREFKQSLYIAKGSAAEVRSMLLLASDLKYLDNEIVTGLHEQSREISRILSGLIKTLD